jgi:hypothetical protein
MKTRTDTHNPTAVVNGPVAGSRFAVRVLQVSANVKQGGNKVKQGKTR